MLSGQQTTDADAAVTKRVKKVREIHVYCTIIKISTENPHSVYHGKLRWGGNKAQKRNSVSLSLSFSLPLTVTKKSISTSLTVTKKSISLSLAGARKLSISLN
jgi:hypothetical protein